MGVDPLLGRVRSHPSNVAELREGVVADVAGVACDDSGDCAPDIPALICAAEYDWPCDQALAVAWCESRLEPWAYNAGNYGVFQVNAVHAWRVGGDLASLFDAATNVRVAYEIWSEVGWSAWACAGG